MSKTSLRDYNHEIEELINNGKTDEAITHCKYILKLFPKSVDTYRLLGKAYLEAQRYSEATDILTRILSVIPDDFVSQIGISIIREDEGNFDAAIYHMERAFEVKPSNSTIQEELRRLYGRRDGITPPRVRLTRGALVRMYTRGELYPQAIAEIRASLSEDPKRVDLEVILARIYTVMGRKVEAIEVCSQLVNKLPNCLEANRILSEILPETPRSEDAEIYRQRVISLDPYSAYINNSAPTSNDVPNDAITLDFLDYQSSPQDGEQPEWAKSVGVDLQKPENVVPEWLVDQPSPKKPDVTEPSSPLIIPPIIPTTQSPDNLPTPPPARSDPARTAPLESTEDEELIPDWMRSAGWSQANTRPAEPEETTPPAEEPAEEIAHAQLPDWIQAISPTEEPETLSSSGEQDELERLDQIFSSPQQESAQLDAVSVGHQPVPDTEEPVAPVEETNQNVEVLAWLDGQSGSQGPVAAEQSPSIEEVPDWITSLNIPSEVSQSTPEVLPTEELPDWLKAFGSETSSDLDEEPSSESTPEWLQNLQLNNQQTNFDGPVSETPDEGNEISGNIPEIQPEMPVISESHAQAVEPAEITLEGNTEEPAAKTQPIILKNIDQPIEGETSQETPSAIIPESGKELLSDEGADEEKIDTSMEWLESLPSQQNVEGTPQRSGGEEIAQSTESEPITLEVHGESEINQETMPGDLPVPSVITTPEEMDLDSAFAWLESLAADQGDKSGPPFVPVDDQQDLPQATFPQSISENVVQTNDEKLEKVEEILPIDEMFSPEQPQVEKEQPTELPARDKLIENLIPSSEPAVTGTPLRPSDDEEALPEWLKDLGAPSPDLYSQSTSSSGESVSTWLENIQSPEEEKAVIPPGSSVKESTNEPPPEWLHETEISSLEEAKEPVEKGLPEWLRGLDPSSGSDVEVLKLEEPIAEQPGSVAEVTIEPAEPSSLPEGISVGETNPEVELPKEQLSEEMSTFEAVDEKSVVSTRQPEDPTSQSDPEQESTPEVDGLSLIASPLEPAEILRETLENQVEAFVQPAGPETQEEIPAEEIPSIPKRDTSQVFAEAHADLDSGELVQALEKYAKLIESDVYLEEIINELQNALYRYPVDIALHEALGDAFSKSNRLQDALDTYTKAEELLL